MGKNHYCRDSYKDLTLSDTLLALAIFIMATYKLYKCMCRPYTLDTALTGMLEFNSNARTVFIPIYSLRGLPKDFVVTATDFIQDITVHCTRILESTAKIYLVHPDNHWSTSRNNHHTSNSAQHRLDSLILFARILQTQYTVHPVFVQNNQITRIITPSVPTKRPVVNTTDAGISIIS